MIEFQENNKAYTRCFLYTIGILAQLQKKRGSRTFFTRTELVK